MAWVLKVYDHTNTTLQGTLTEAHSVRFSDRLGTIGALTFTVDIESTDDLALLDWRRVVRLYPDEAAIDPIESFFVDDKPAELLTDTELPSVTFQCPSLDAWLGTSDMGGAVVYPFGGLGGLQQEPRRFGPEALEFDDTGWASPPSTDGTVSLGGEDVPWFTSTNRSLYRLVIPAASGSFPGRMLLRASRRLEVRVYLNADRVLSKQTGQTGVTQFDVDYDDAADRVVLIDVAGSGKVAWAWGVVTDDDDEDLGDIEFDTGTSGWRQLDNYTTYPGMTPGYIAKTLVDEAQTRGALAGLTYDFDEDQDSDEVAWSGTVAHAFAVGSKLGWVLEQITQFGYDWKVAPDGTLQLFEFLGSDLTASVDLDVLESSRADGTGIKATAMLWLSAGSMSESDVTVAVGRIEEAATFGTSDSAVKLEAVVAELLDDLSIPRDTQRLTLSQESPQPFDDFDLGDVVAYTGRDGGTSGRVTEVVGAQDDADGTVTWDVTVDFEDGQFSRERARRVRDQLRETFAQTIGGRALLAAPRAEGLPPAQVTSVEGEGTADPRTITVETESVDIPEGGLLLPWQRLTSLMHLVRVPEPDYPNTVVTWPAGAVVLPRIELEWDAAELEPEVGPDSISYPFRGGGQVALKVNGLFVWPFGVGSTEPSAAEGIHRRFESTLPALHLAEGDEVEVEVDHGDDDAHTLARGLLTLTLVEPFRGPAAPIGDLAGDPEVACTNGPHLWVRFAGGDDDAINMLEDYRDAEDNLCADGARHTGEPFITHSDGPYGAASYRQDSGGGDGDQAYQRDELDACVSMIARIRVDAMASGGNSGWLIAPTGATGAASSESSALGMRRISGEGVRGVNVRWREENHPVNLASGWQMLGVTFTGDFNSDPRIVVMLNGKIVIDTPVATGVPVDPINWRFFRGIDTFGTSFQSVFFAGLAEVVAWPVSRRLTVSQLHQAQIRLAHEGRV